MSKSHCEVREPGAIWGRIEVGRLRAPPRKAEGSATRGRLMPGGVDLLCRACGHKRIATSWLEYRLDGGEMKALGHPGEAQDLEALGATLEGARDQGRLFQCADWACSACGRLCESREVIVPGKPFWRQSFTKNVLWAEIVAIMGLGVYEIAAGRMQTYVCPAMAVFAASAVVLGILDTRAESAAWGNRGEMQPPPECPHCGRKDLASPTYKHEEVAMTCDVCGKREMVVTSSWIA